MPIGGGRRFEIAASGECVAERVVGLRETGAELERALGAGDRLVVAAERNQHRGEVVVNFRHRRRLGGGPRIFGGRFSVAALGLQQVTEMKRGLGVVRCGGGGGAEQALGFGGVARAEQKEPVGLEHDDGPGCRLERAVIELARIIGPTGLGIERGQVVERADMAGVGAERPFVAGDRDRGAPGLVVGKRFGEGGVGLSHVSSAQRRRGGRTRGRFALPCAQGHDFAASGQGETGMASVQAGAAQVRQFGVVNWVGVYTLCRKEVHRFMKIPGQTILAPAVTALLFLAIFSVALDRSLPGVTVGYLEFLAPGLIMMSAMQNAFANTSSTLIISKVQGTIVDVLMPPLSPGELAFCFAVSGAIRGLVVGIVVAFAMYAVVPFTLHSAIAVAFFSLATALVLSLIGLIVGVWGVKFDNIASITNFVIIPLSMLSGTFYAVEQLPGVWRTVSHFNPFFYMIDGARYGFTGHHDGALWIGYVGLSALTAALAAVAYAMLKRGYRLKA